MENQTILFSIIIPTYNRRKQLQRAINSIFDQSSGDWEIIIVDDGSTDDTSNFLKTITDDRVTTIYQENKERSAARNAGIKIAKGQYICFLDDDDYFLPNHLEVLEKEIRKHGFRIAIFRTGMITKTGKREVKTPFYNNKNSNHPILFFLKNMVGIHTLCYHHIILEKYNYDERWFHFQDTHLLIRCLLEFPFFQINEYTAVYVRYPEMGSLSVFKSSNAEARTENNVNAIKDLFRQGGNRLLRLVPNNLSTRLVAQKYLDHAGGALYVGRKKLAAKYFWRSLKISKGRFLFISYFKFSLRYCFSYFK